MKKLNKKGFTLIELMVVIAILVVIMGIALPNITSSIERSKEKQIEKKIQLIESAAELYFDHKTREDKEKGAKVSTIIDNQQIPGVTSGEVCKEDDCCVKYEINAETNVYEFVVKTEEGTSSCS